MRDQVIQGSFSPFRATSQKIKKRFRFALGHLVYGVEDDVAARFINHATPSFSQFPRLLCGWDLRRIWTGDQRNAADNPILDELRAHGSSVGSGLAYRRRHGGRQNRSASLSWVPQPPFDVTNEHPLCIILVA